MNCPVCGGKTKVIDSRADCETVQRKRLCDDCKYMFYTSEEESDGKDYKDLASVYFKAHLSKKRALRRDMRAKKANKVP